MLRFLTVIALLALTCATSSAQTIWYVDASSPGGNGQSWATAFQDLQEALDAAGPGSEIWVAEGVYVPSRQYSPGSPRTETFLIFPCDAMFGGFPVGGGSMGQRDPALHETVLSGDQNGDDLPGFVNRGDNSRIVVLGNRNVSGGILDGFTIRGGDLEGIIINGPTPPYEFRNCVITDNGSGGRVFCDSPVLANCTVIGNAAGGLSFSGNTPTITDCRFVDNGGRGLECTDAVITGCTFSGNSSSGDGGGIRGSDCDIVDCTFDGNSATGNGGGLWLDGNSRVSGCTITRSTV